MGSGGSGTVRAARADLEGAVREAVGRALLPRLGAADAPFTLRIPERGRSSLVYLMRLEDGRSFAVRVGRGRAARKALRRRRRTADFWTARGLPTPPVQVLDVSLRTRLATGLSLLCEERVDGPEVVDCPADHPAWAATGRAFAQVHAVTRRLHHGSFFQPRVGRYGYRMRKRHGEWTRALVRSGRFDPDLARDYHAWLEGFREPLDGVKRFNLLHRRCTESDVLYDEPSARTMILEPHRCGFGCFVRDLVRLEDRVCRDEEARVAAVHTAYFDAAPSGARETYEALAPVYRADLHLANALRFARRLDRGDVEAEPRWNHAVERLRKQTGL